MQRIWTIESRRLTLKEKVIESYLECLFRRLRATEFIVARLYYSRTNVLVTKTVLFISNPANLLIDLTIKNFNVPFIQLQKSSCIGRCFTKEQESSVVKANF